MSAAWRYQKTGDFGQQNQNHGVKTSHGTQA